MTPAIRKINRLPPYLVSFNTTFHSATYFVAFDWMYHFSTPHQWFTCVHLLYPYLISLMAKPFPKRSIPWLFTTAPLGGLMPPPARRHRWASCSFATSTISITACNELYCRFTASRHTMQSAGLKAVSYTHLRAHETDSYLVCRLL